jgi:DHA1 family tetracycline resistance protein-like MFS transporter
MFLFAFATQSWMMFIFLIPYCLGGLAGPALQATISGHVPPNEQGELQGGLTSLMSLTFVFGPTIMSQLFFISPKTKPRYIFPVLLFCLGVSLCFRVPW